MLNKNNVIIKMLQKGQWVPYSCEVHWLDWLYKIIIFVLFYVTSTENELQKQEKWISDNQHISKQLKLYWNADQSWCLNPYNRPPLMRKHIY